MYRARLESIYVAILFKKSLAITYIVLLSSALKFIVCIMLKLWRVIVEPAYYGHLGTSKKCPDYQGVRIFQIILYEEVPFGTLTKCLD